MPKYYRNSLLDAHRRAKMPRPAIHQALALARHTPASLFFVDDGDGDDVEVEVDVDVDAEVEVAVPVVLAVFTKTYISPVSSLLMNRRPWESKSNPTGRKQLLGHFELSAFVKISVVEVRLSDCATGDPFSNGMVTTLYPTGSVRSLFLYVSEKYDAKR